MEFYQAMKQRRSRYDITDASPISNQRVQEILTDAITHTPSAFHSQSSRVVLLFGNRHQKLWNIVLETLRAIVPADKFSATETKIASFAAGHGTILYFEDQDTVKTMQKNVPLYAENFPIWSLQSAGMLQYAVWTALSQEGLGASLQHYNPLIDEAVHAAFDVPASWTLLAQMPFGAPNSEPGALEYKPMEERLIVQGGAMIKTIDSRNMGRSELGWLHSLFHFSFAEYYNPDNLQFGMLRVVNDDLIEPGTGFDTHPHANMEIVSYVIDGVLTHRDSMGNQRELTRGQVQYMSAGTGVTHSEFNLTDGVSRFLQIWILPDKKGYQPNYGDYQFDWTDRENKWLQIVSGDHGNAPVKIHQDMNISVVSLDAGRELSYTLQNGRQAYLIQIEGEGMVNGNSLSTRDAAEITEESTITLQATTQSHYILFDMKA